MTTDTVAGVGTRALRVTVEELRRQARDASSLGEYGLSNDLTDRAMRLDAVLSALDALTAATEPIRAHVDFLDGIARQCGEPHFRDTDYRINGSDLRALLDCITTLTRGSHATD